jgi:hypothetical protein
MVFIIRGREGEGRGGWAQNLPGDVRAGQEPVVEHCPELLAFAECEKVFGAGVLTGKTGIGEEIGETHVDECCD